MPKISYIVAAYENATVLAGCLSSLLVQTMKDHEIIVMDNSLTTDGNEAIQDLISVLDPHADYVKHIALQLKTCYHSANFGANLARGEFLCFPNADSYYMPKFAEKLTTPVCEVVYCDMVYDDRQSSRRYDKMVTSPRQDNIDKTCFIIKRRLFTGFRNLPEEDIPCNADGAMIEEAVRRGLVFGKVNEVLVVHN